MPQVNKYVDFYFDHERKVLGPGNKNVAHSLSDSNTNVSNENLDEMGRHISLIYTEWH